MFLHNARYCSNDTEVKPLGGTMRVTGTELMAFDCTVLLVLFGGGGALL